MQEEWRPVVGYEDLYEVSNTGKVRSVCRFTDSVRSRLGKQNSKFYHRNFISRELKPCYHSKKGNKYHLHKRIDGKQLDSYHYVEDLIRQSFKEEE